jgi:hypothetical protein
MRRIIWTLLLAIVLTSLAEAAGTARPCTEVYASMPPSLLNYLPALILNAKDKGRDVFRIDTAFLVADKTDECTITYRYHEQGEQTPPTCTETVNLCAVSGPPPAISTEASSTREPVVDHEAEFKKKMLEKDRAVKEQVEEEYRRGIRKHWEDEEEKEEFLRVIIKYKEDADKQSVLEDVKSVGGEMVSDEDKKYLPRVIVIKIRKEKKQDLIKKLKANPHIEHFYKSFLLHGGSIAPGEPLL